TLALCCVDPARIPAEVLDEHVELARKRAGFADVGEEFLAAARSVMATSGLVGGRPYRRGIRTVEAPVLLVHGVRDRLVPLAAGGVLGAAWTAGALVALQERLPRPLGEVDLVVGTSAGSVMAAALRCGVGVQEIVDHQRGTHLTALPHLRDLDGESGPKPPLP